MMLQYEMLTFLSLNFHIIKLNYHTVPSIHPSSMSLSRVRSCWPFPVENIIHNFNKLFWETVEGFCFNVLLLQPAGAQKRRKEWANRAMIITWQDLLKINIQTTTALFCGLLRSLQIMECHCWVPVQILSKYALECQRLVAFFVFQIKNK